MSKFWHKDRLAHLYTATLFVAVITILIFCMSNQWLAIIVGNIIVIVSVLTVIGILLYVLYLVTHALILELIEDKGKNND